MSENPPVALVTGASGGIGKEISLRLARDGYHIAAVARTDDHYPGNLRDTVDEIRSAGGTATAFECDLSVASDRASLVARVEDSDGPVAVLVNNAAVSTMEPLAIFRPKRLTLMFDVQVRAPLELAQQVIPAMRARGSGAIINVSSPAAKHPPAPGAGTDEALGAEIGRTTIYGMCKAALERLTVGLAGELYNSGINVNALAPTFIVPTFGAAAFFDLADFDAEPADAMADAVSYLIDPKAPRITGRILYSQAVLEMAGYPVPRLLPTVPAAEG